MSKLNLTEYEQTVLNETIDILLKLNIAEPTNHKEFGGMRFSEWTWENYEILRDNGIYCDSGATKMVFIVDGLEDWVIKVPFLFSEKTAPGNFRHCDACSAEAKVFTEAVDSGLQEYFAACYHYKTVGDIPFYIQEKADCNPDNNEDILFDKVSTSYNREDYDSEDAYYSAIHCEVDEMGDEERLDAFFGDWVGKLMNFLFDRELNDFHCANLGFIGLRPVLIDYSGY